MKAASGCRTPKPRGSSGVQESAAALCRFPEASRLLRTLIISRANFIVQAIAGKHQPERHAIASNQVKHLRAVLGNRTVWQKANFGQPWVIAHRGRGGSNGGRHP